LVVIVVADTFQLGKSGGMESTKAVIVQVDDLLTFRQFSKKSADDAIDVCDFENFRGLGG
jgi:hypothetical protein